MGIKALDHKAEIAMGVFGSYAIAGAITGIVLLALGLTKIPAIKNWMRHAIKIAGHNVGERCMYLGGSVVVAGALGGVGLAIHRRKPHAAPNNDGTGTPPARVSPKHAGEEAEVDNDVNVVAEQHDDNLSSEGLGVNPADAPPGTFWNPILPAGWERHRDEETGAFYFHNPQTQAFSWTLPSA